MMDTENMDTPQRVLVADSARQLREERENVTLISRDGQGGADVGEASLPDFVPCRYHPGGIFEDLPALAVEQMRPSVVEGQSWENIEETRSTPSSVKALLRECEGTGVTFLIPTRSQRPWSPPLGFQCIYESYFQDETKLWCPIPRLITSYVRRRDAAISQFFNGAFRTSVALMVTAAEIDVLMSVRTLEELTYTKSMGDGLLSIQMRPNYNVIVDHPYRTAHWQGFYFYVKSGGFAFEEPPDVSFQFLWNHKLVDHPDTASYPEDFVSDARAVVSRVQVSWKDITIERIRRVLDRISSRDWRSDLLPLITGNKRRFSIFSSAEQKIINAARKMKELPDLSALIKKKLSEAKKASSVSPSETTLSGTTPREETPREETPRVKTPRGAIPPAPLPLVISPGPSTGPGNVDSSRDDLTLISKREIAEPSVTGGNKKISAPDSSALAASQARTESDGAENCEIVIEKGSSRDAAARGVVDSDNSPSISLKKKKTARSHESSTPAASAFAAKTSPAAPRTLVEGSSASEDRRVKFHDRVEFKYVGETPLSFAPTDCAELVRQIKGGRKDFPAVKDLIFKDAYVDAARTKILVRIILLGVKFHDRVEFKYVGETPLSFAPTGCAELVRQIKGGRKDLPAVKDLIFQDAYVDAARTKILSDGSMNYVVELYDSALKEAMSKLKHANKLTQAKDVAIDRKTKEFKATIDKVAEDRAQLIERKKAQKAHFLEYEDSRRRRRLG
ncbi:PREDICTED: uncharacterized protein LOC106302655 [Brassica oleracea var. oleracea]|uniref:uncharacterized protein LOC106302655 n=1 Tax=Brassica oleracea var. oleracea TaxID=109376 RepID=UPI0006A6EF8D|nr:PREDICTED: uncharacterized protein LOC106302655 [Brassica oleracea var. oleracea]